LHRANTLHYNPKLVDEPPADLDELMVMCDDFETNGGVPPLAMVWAGWVHQLLFLALLPAEVVGGTEKDVSANGVVRTTFYDTLAAIKSMHDRGCIATPPARVGEHDWGEAARMIIGDETTAKAKMFIHGDWAKGLLVAEGRSAGTDFAVTFFTGGPVEAFQYIGDTLAINAEAQNPALAERFAQYALSVEGQVAFNERKGSTPAIVIDNPNTAIKNRTLRETYLELAASVDAGTFVPNGGWHDACGAFVEQIRPKVVDADGDLVPNPDYASVDLDDLADGLLDVYKSR
jgi:glucose/mannose transport system substrate-binding protein